ncbi:hypothetical protein QQZ08_004796 [Neonectria magnoliae]|uniref:F-box domain-containing protein n=1 Tax=Neonectria magnoliae TaxID=2732573 RepID=A0ABR1I786_9HYPO
MVLGHVPDEIIQHLLYYVSPEDTLSSFQLLSHRLNRLANEPLLWRYHCQSSFRYWSPEHGFHCRLRERASEVDWKRLFVLRKTRNGQISHLLDEVLATKVGRLNKFEQICRLGYDAKDFLLDQCHNEEPMEDILARRYYSNSILDSIHRSLAIEEWHLIQTVHNTPAGHASASSLERALGAFDLFVLHDQPGDLDDIARLLDDKALEFRNSMIGVDEMSTRQKALALNRWLRAHNMTGLVNPERSYRNLRNCLIGQALRHEDHDSIPIISSAIYCCIAERLGLQAQCCSFPTHVHAIVFAEHGKTLDGISAAQNGAQREMMYLDPYGSDDEIPMAALQAMLSQFGWQASTDVFLAPVPPISVAMRSARNIRATAARVVESREQTDPELTQLMSGNGSINLDAALYSALWAALLMTPVNVFAWDESLEPFLRRFAKSWHEDAWLVEKYLVPLYDQFAPLRERFAGHHPPQGWDDPREILSRVRELDDLAPPVFRRDRERMQPVAYKIGQVFQHRRYRWIGVINGWTDQGTRRLPMPHTVAIDETLSDSSDTELPSLVRPRNQTFYTCLRTTGPERHVVAEDNIVLIQNADEVPERMFPLAGKFFKRFDATTCTFVSNIKEQYPDD